MDAGAANTRIVGNYIGTDVSGLLARETATGAIGALVAAPRVSAAREAMGEQYTGTDLLLDATIGGLTGATVAGGMHYGGRAIDALPPHARVIFLGDRDQLASVEAGAV